MIKKLATACRRNGKLDASSEADYLASPPNCLSLPVFGNSQKGTRTGESSPGGLQPRRNVRRTDAEIFREGTIQIHNFQTVWLRKTQLLRGSNESILALHVDGV
jgi:hypothetical protein